MDGLFSGDHFPVWAIKSFSPRIIGSKKYIGGGFGIVRSKSLDYIGLTSKLMESEVKFVSCDMPEANKTSIHIMVALAQQYANYISQRTKEGLRAKKERDNWKPGTDNLTDDARQKAHTSISRKAREDIAVRHAWHFICTRRVDGMSYEKIAEELNRED
jgi:DNA invertase Pin-like site-specific DNA recombinase